MTRWVCPWCSVAVLARRATEVLHECPRRAWRVVRFEAEPVKAVS